jgi:hypothetical protein
MKKNFMYWAAGSAILVVIFGSIYGVGQYILRAGADDPQLQLAEDTAAQLNAGHPIDGISTQTVNIASSLAPFVVIYDNQGNPIAGSARLDGQIPKIPKGVLGHAKPQHRVTWQPRDDVRIAAVVQASDKGYVVAGRSLREVERRENTALALTAIGGLVSETGLTTLFAYREKRFRASGTGNKKKTA